MSDNVKVVIKIRPLIDREKNASATVYWATNNGKEIHSTKLVSHSFIYDRVFEAERTNMEVYQETARPIVRSAMLGFNGTIFAYGQTSSGKTYTIMGKTDSWGVIPLSIGEIFETIENTPNRIFLLRVSYMEIYNENVTDLLSGQNKLKIHESQNGDVFVGDLAEEIVRDPETIYALLQKGEARRHVGETNMNDKSSRSHTIFRIIIESRELNSGDMENAIPEASDSCENIVTVSHLNIVDLAGSERAAQTGATGDRLKEGCAINKSLFTLAQVISKLSDNAGQTGQSSNTIVGSGSDNPQFVNFRDSKLTRILQNSLGGNSKTAIICTVTPASLDETSSTLKFANRAKDIKNKPIKNEVGSDEAMLRRCQKQINELKKQINDLSGSSNIQALQIEKDNLAKQLTEKEEKISQLMHLICISSKIVLSPAQKGNREVMKNRRITWCPGINNKLMAFSPFPVNSKRYKPEVPPVTELPESSFVAVDRDSLIRDFDLLEKDRVSFPDSVNDRRKFCDADCQTEESASISANFETTQESLRSEIQKLQEEKKLLFDQYKSMISKHKSQNADVVALTSDLECAKKLNQELDDENRRLLEKKDESRIFYQDELESLSASRDQCQKLMEESVKMDEKVGKLNEELQEANRQFEQMMTENWTINRKLRTLTHENLQKENLLQEKNVELENLRVEIDKLKASENNMEGISGQIDQLVEQIDRKDNILREQEVETKILRDDLEQLKNSQKFVEENKELTVKLDEKEKTLRNYEEEISLLKDALPRLEHQLIEKDGMLDDSKREIETLRGDLDKMKIDEKMHEENNRNFESRFNELIQQNREHREKLNNYESDIAILRQQIDSKETLDEKYNELTAKLDDKENVLRNYEEELSKLKDALPQLQNQLSTRDEMVHNCKREIEALRCGLDKMKIDEKVHEENDRKFQSRVNELIQQDEENRQKLNDYERDIDILRQQINSKENLDGKNNELTAKLEVKEKMLRVYELENFELKDSLPQLMHQLAEKNEILDNNKQVIETLRRDLDKMKIHEGNIGKLENRIIELMQQNEDSRQKFDDYEREIVILRQNFDEENNRLAEKLSAANNILVENEREMVNLRIELANVEMNEVKEENFQNVERRIDELLRQNYEKESILSDYKQQIEALGTELNSLKQNERIKEETFKRHLDELIDQSNQKENMANNFKREIEILRQKLDILRQSRRLDELQKETKQRSKIETQLQEIDALRRKLDEKKKLEKELQRKIELEAQKSKQPMLPPAGSLCRGGIVEEHKIHMLDRELYRSTKKMERLEKQLEIVTRQRDDAVIKLTEFELPPKKEKEKLTVGRSSLDCSTETEHLPSKITTGSDVIESNYGNFPIPQYAKDQTFTLPRKSVSDSIENTSAVDKSIEQEMRDKCKQQ